ncbi:glycosyltransferase domain-containing protein [Pedobacter sp. L105]|uniref:glycosyltransferase domain-containing protein n=1 Tax=Pedobacter sp. L105 TaxID=1641871 RepID=UPI00131B7B49|nr:glycosyltransferase domain-containing protein [Pedobacter sp. L105]
MKRIRLVSAAFGDDTKELVIQSPLIYKDYVVDVALYNNDNTKSRHNSLTTRLKSKIPKMMEWLHYPDYDFYIWVDSKFTIHEGFLEHLFRYEGEADLFLFKHPRRSSIKAESDYVNNKIGDMYTYWVERYGGEYIKEQVNLYLSDENFIDDQLFSLGCFMFTSDLVKNKEFNLMKDWFLENVLYSGQDQLSLPYLLYKHQVNYKVYPENIMDSSFLKHDFFLG